MSYTRQRIADLLSAHVPVGKIATIVGVHRNTVANVRKDVENRGTAERKEGSGGHNRKRTEEFLADLSNTIEADPSTSMRKLAKKAGVSEGTIRNSVVDLELTSYVRRRRQLLTKTTKKTRVAKGKKLLARCKKEGPSTVRIFSDKKLWTVDQARNARNDRWLAYHVEDVPPINVTKHPASAMMLGVVSSDGKRMPPYWFPKGLKIGTVEYLDVLINVVKPWLDAQYPDGNYVWQQDSAPSHRAKMTQEWCAGNLSAFWPWGIWPPASPDLNPLDYAIWGNVERVACARPHPSVDALKAAVEQEWANMSAEFVIKSCKAFRSRLETMLVADGGHFEK